MKSQVKIRKGIYLDLKVIFQQFCEKNPLTNLLCLRSFQDLHSLGGMAKLLLDHILKQKKISKRQFAKLIRTAYPTVFRYFRPKYDPKLSTLEKWARALGVQIRDLFRE